MSESLTSNPLLQALADLIVAYVGMLESARDRILFYGGQCDDVETMERGDPHLRKAKSALASARRDVPPSAGIDAAIEATKDVKLPLDVRVGAGVFKRGVPVSTMLMSIRNHIGYAQKPGYPFQDGYLDKRPVISGVKGCSRCHGSGFDVTGAACPCGCRPPQTKSAQCVWSKSCTSPPKDGSLLCDQHYREVDRTAVETSARCSKCGAPLQPYIGCPTCNLPAYP